MNSSSQVSLDTPVDERTYNDKDTYAIEGYFVEGLTLADFVEDSKSPTHFDNLDRLQMRELLGEVLNTLTPHERRVLSIRTSDEVAKIFRVSGDNIQSVEAKALRKLRAPACSTKLRDFY